MVAKRPTSKRRVVRRSTPDAIHKMEEHPQHIRMMLYADPGTGKTPLAATSPGRMLLLNADGPDGPESARVFSRYKGDIWDMKNYKDLDAAYEHLRHDGGYDWVWFDSITLFQESGMDQIMHELIASKPHRNRYVPDQLQYVENQNHIATWVRNMCALDSINFGITAHVMRVEDDDDGRVTYMPAIQGGGKIPLTTRICGHMTIVGRLYVVTKKEGDAEKTFRVLQTTPSEKWFAKDRFGALPAKMTNPTMGKVLAAINGEPPARRRAS